MVESSLIELQEPLAYAASFGVASLSNSLDRFKSAVLRRYADWRVGATRDERFAYRTSDTIMLTFDDHGTPDQVHRILGTLKAANVKAMFFLEGKWAQANRHLVEEIQAAGHIIGNHTYSHPNLLDLDDEAVSREITQGLDVELVRPPMGRYNKRIRRIVHGLGKKIVYWSLDSDDWQGASTKQMSRKILSELHPGAVILFHIHAENTIELLPELIQAIRARQFELESLL